MKEIVNGILNNMFPEEEVEAEAKRRLFVCLLPEDGEPHCIDYNPDGMLGPKCMDCGCTLKYKIRSESQCPRGKWKQ